MTNDEIYDFIGELAIALYSKKIQISLGSLRTIMLDKGKDYVNNRGMASAVSAAYRRWKEKDPIIYYAIAYTYTDREGNLAWDDPKKAPEKAVEAAVEGNEDVQDVAAEEAPKDARKSSSKKKPAEAVPEAMAEQDLFSEPAEADSVGAPEEQAEPEEVKAEETAEEIGTSSQKEEKPAKKTAARKKAAAEKDPDLAEVKTESAEDLPAAEKASDKKKPAKKKK